MRELGLWTQFAQRHAMANDPTATCAFKLSPLWDHLCALEDLSLQCCASLGWQQTVNHRTLSGPRQTPPGCSGEGYKERVCVDSAWLWGLLDQQQMDQRDIEEV